MNKNIFALYMAIALIIGENIQRYRKALGISQLELCDKIAISQSRMSQLENGKALMSIKTLVKIAKQLKVEPYQLLKDPKKEDQSLKILLDDIEQLPDNKKISLMNIINSVLREQELSKGK